MNTNLTKVQSNGFIIKNSILISNNTLNINLNLFHYKKYFYYIRINTMQVTFMTIM